MEREKVVVDADRGEAAQLPRGIPPSAEPSAAVKRSHNLTHLTKVGALIALRGVGISQLAENLLMRFRGVDDHEDDRRRQS